MIRRIVPSKDDYRTHKRMSEMCNRKVKYGRNRVSESKNGLHKRGLKESVRFARDMADEIAEIAANEFNGTTMEDLEDFMNSELDEIISNYINNSLIYSNDCIKIVQNSQCFDWSDAKSVIGHEITCIEDAAYYAIMEAMESVDIYGTVENELRDMINETEDEDEYDYV